jgi:tripartite-type tricarboxylate transporter receptor subunit TctC
MQTPSRRDMLAGATALILASGRAIAQEDTIRIVYPFAAGGTGDAVVRLIAEQLQKDLGAPVIVENKGGAGGRIGALAVKKSAPNGATLLFAGMSQIAIQPHIYAKLGYDPLADFVPISQSVKFDLGLAVSSTLPVRSLPELLTWLKAHPEQASYGSPGAGSLPFFVGAEFSRIIGQQLNHVAYRGTPAALPDLLSGRIPLYIAAAAELVEQHRSGGLRVLAIAATSRSALLPDVPTLKESGIDLAATAWFAFYVPAGTPVEMVGRLEQRIVVATQAPQIRAKIRALGYEPIGATSDALRTLQQAEFERWGAIVRASGFKADAE